MSIEIKKIANRSDLKEFILFPYELYKDCENWVPALRGDEFDTFNPKHNGAFEYCDADYFLAYKNDKIVGRVAAIINHKANETWHQAVVRFGWIEFIDDVEVLKALVDAVSVWGKERGCTMIKGPLGFTDMDREGLLVDGYEHLSPFTCLYNYPYYDKLLKQVGFDKDVDWTQSIVDIPDALPSSFQYADLIERRFGLRAAKAHTMLGMCLRYGMSIFHMYNETFAPLFQFTPLTDRQIKRYLLTYIPILNKDFVCVLIDANDRPVGFAFCVPSLSKVVKKSNGRLLPFGFLRILHAIRHNDTLEALMIGILPEYQGKGGIVPIFKYIHENCIKFGITKMITNPQLETNYKVQSMWNDYKTEPFMRRRSYCKSIE